MMHDWHKIVVTHSSTVLEAMKVLDSNDRFVIVTDGEGKLTGCITDGDLRRGLLKGIRLTDQASEIMNKNPFAVAPELNHQEVLERVKQYKQDASHVPVVDSQGLLVNVHVVRKVVELQKDNPVILMAGGLGTRLGELTTSCPKPLLKIDNKPILEIILNNFRDAGFRNIFISVNYKSHMIEEYFGDGSGFGIDLKYIRETEQLGTAGSLSLADLNSNLPVIVMNADILTRVDFSKLLEHHEKSEALGTMCVRKYEFEVPYGVISTEDGQISSISEKPRHSFLVNSGIYVLSPNAIKRIPLNTYYNMPQLFEGLVEDRYKTSVYPLHEYWLDIGNVADFKQAQFDFKKFF